MRAAPLITCCWPGLARLWLRGQWSGLATAALFALALNAALMATFIRPELLGGLWTVALWLVVAAWWLGGGYGSYRRLPSLAAGELAAGPGGATQDLQEMEQAFQSAQTEYLQRNWCAAEQQLSQLLRRRPGDVDAQLMLATLYRHTERFDLAGERLALLERLEGAGKWSLEIFREKELIAQLAEESDATETDEQAEAATQKNNPSAEAA